jgi:hypothetical protein
LGRVRTRIPSLSVTVLVLMAACADRPPEAVHPPREEPTASTSPSNAPEGGWRALRNAPIESYRPEGLFWVDDQLLVVAGSTVMRWDPNPNVWDVLIEIPQADECEGCGYSETVVWTGQELILWGGGFTYANGFPQGGAAFDPRASSLRPIPDAPIPVRWWHTAVWTGTEMVVWGGSMGDERADGAAYDPFTDTWRRIPDAPMGGYAHSAVWTGEEMIVWGGSDDAEGEGRQGYPSRFIAEGAAYRPSSDSWRSLSASPLEGRGWHSAVWTGEEMIVWGGDALLDAGDYPTDGAAYNPASDAWRPISQGPLSGRVEHSGVWTGREMVLWGGSVMGRSVTRDDGATYDPSLDLWTMLPPSPLDSRALHAALWTGEEMVVWGGCCHETRSFIGGFGDGAVYRPG